MMLGPKYNYVSTLLNFGTTPESPETDSPLFEAGAQLMLHLGKQLFVYLKPMYGWLDYGIHDFLSGAAIRDRKELDTIYWANFYGKEYIDKYGSQLFLDAPSWRKEALLDGSIVLQVSELYTKPLSGEEKTKLQQYFSDRGINLSNENPFEEHYNAA